MLLKPQKRSAFLFRSYQVALGIGGTERYRWLEEVLGQNHVYQISPVLYMTKPPGSMTLFFSKDAVLEYVQTPKKKHDKNKKYGSFATKEGEVVKCSLYEGNHDLDDCNSFLQFDLQERSGCFITNCVMVVLVQFMSIVMLGITRTKRNAKFVRKDTQPLCMIIKQRKVKLSSRMATLQQNQK